MWLELAAGAYLLSDWIYSKNNPGDSDSKRRPDREIQVPRVDSRAPFPLLYGRCLVRSPIVADIRVVNQVGEVVLVDMLIVCGMCVNDGAGTSRVRDMWAGDRRFVTTVGMDSSGKWTQTGAGGPEATIATALEDAGGGLVETLNGNPSQVLANDGDTPTATPSAQLAPTWAGRRMLDPQDLSAGRSLNEIPGLRGYLSVFLFNFGEGSGWSIESATSVPSYSFEFESRPAATSPAGPYASIGLDMNPVDVIHDALVYKLGISEDYIDIPSFKAAGYTLWAETHGYSRAWEDPQDVGGLIISVLEQILGVLYEEPSTGKFVIKLIRADFDPTLIKHITKDNCYELTGFAMSGWTNLPTAVRLVYRNREKNYAEDDEPAIHQANAAGTDGQTRWKVIEYPGVTTRTLAFKLAWRELNTRSRPMMKMTAIGDRSLVDVRPGDALKITWSGGPDLSGIIVRCIGVNHGSLEDGRITLDLVTDQFEVPPKTKTTVKPPVTPRSPEGKKIPG